MQASGIQVRPKNSLNHVKQAVHACERLGYFNNYQAAKKAHGESKKAHSDAVSEYETAVEERDTDSNEDANRDANLHIAILEGEVKRQEEKMRQAEETRVVAADAFLLHLRESSLYRSPYRLGKNCRATNRYNPLDGLEGQEAHESAIEDQEVIR